MINEFIYCVICLIMMMLPILFLTFGAIKKHKREESEKKVLLARLQSYEKQTELLEKSREQMNLFFHDFRHFYHIQSECLKNGDTAGALETLQSTFSQINKVVSKESFIKSYTGFNVIDSLISYYEYKMGEEDINLTVGLNITQIPSNTTEFAIAMSNALENAYHACQKQPMGELRLVRLMSLERAGNLFLELSNTYSAPIIFDQDGLPKGMKKNHGYGTKSILSYVKNNGGQMKCFIDDRWFHLQLTLLSDN